MMHSTSPTMRGSSPAISEISVGSPSPPPPARNLHHITAFRPLNMKRLRPSSPTLQAQLQARRKSSVERVKSFSIADILGKNDSETDSQKPTASSVAAATNVPVPASLPAISTVPSLHERLQAPLVQTTPSALTVLPQPPPPHHVLLDAVPATLSKVMHHWDPVRGPIPLPPFFSPAILQYEQRLAWDYQRQLQEHFQAQAQLLRQMSMDPTIIPSEDGSERSHSSSTGSDCCSPEVNVSSNSADLHAADKGDCQTLSADSTSGDKNGKRQTENCHTTSESNKKAQGDTPLDALFQLSTKNFDEEQDPATLNIFATRPNPKKKRKSRTAFTNHQIFELEKRFLYQKYLSPADRDEIAAGLGLSNAQVITWFQNRRAKLKRDMEELKKDVESVKQLHDQSADISLSYHYHQLLQQQHQHHQQQQQQQQQHLVATLNQQTNHTSAAAAAASSTTHNGQPVHSPILSLRASAASTTTTAAPTPGSQRGCNSTTTEDKKELKMLKMMTLMYYSSRSVAAAAPPHHATDATEPTARDDHTSGHLKTN